MSLATEERDQAAREQAHWARIDAEHEEREQREAALTEAYADGRADERAEWVKLRDRLIDELGAIHDYFDGRADVVDGSYGEPHANQEMHHERTVRLLLEALEAL